jgi:RimJ/RimL family protein N-acetyltransferase
MNKFREIIDEYLTNYKSYEEGRVSFDCIYGDLIFNKQNDDICILHSIYICPKYRNQGFCREILRYLIDQCTNKFKYFCVETVISKILYSYLLRFKHNNKKFINTRDGFIFKLK